MQNEIIISWFAANSNNTVKDEHRSALEKNTEEKIQQMMAQGVMSGEIVEKIPSDNNDALYKGFWSAEKRVLQ